MNSVRQNQFTTPSWAQQGHRVEDMYTDDRSMDTPNRGRPSPGGEEARVVNVQPRGVGLNTPGSSPDTTNTTPRSRIICKFSRPLVVSAPFARRTDTAGRRTDLPPTPLLGRHILDLVTAETAHLAERGRVAAFFDLDKTIIAKSSTLAFSKPFFDQGLINRRAVLKSSYAQFLFLLSGADHDQMERMRAHITNMCAGWDVEQIKTIVAETLHDIVDPLVFAEAADLIADHKLRGHDVIIVSASGEEVVTPIAEALGATHSTASRMVVEDGRYTGELDFYCYGEGKAESIKALAERYHYDLAHSYAYSDSSTDLPMLAAVGHPTAVNPDRALRKEAAGNGWPILTFSNPIPLRARLSTPSSTTIAATVAVAVSALAAGAFTYAALRRKH